IQIGAGSRVDVYVIKVTLQYSSGWKLENDLRADYAQVEAGRLFSSDSVNRLIAPFVRHSFSVVSAT
ncbi:MAG: hypothetical protein E6680_28480, partial [Klebsiella sp.]|uniref:hypothetical protein n=1 Tax=Klebsiella sp. TaxID=576 RepID=UPI002904FA14